MAPSSSGLGRRPLKAKVAGSNPVGATKLFQATFYAAFLMAPSSSGLGRRPLKAKVAGSNPVGATKHVEPRQLPRLFCWPSLNVGFQFYSAVSLPIGGFPAPSVEARLFRAHVIFDKIAAPLALVSNCANLCSHLRKWQRDY